MSNGNEFDLISPNLPNSYRLPAIVNWNRIEPRPRSIDFDRSLRAEVHDALWMLTRQWQFGEFKGKDGGTAISAKIKIQTTRVTRFAARSETGTDYDDSLPLETRVEREDIPKDILLRIQMGYQWFKLLDEEGLNDLRVIYRSAYPIEMPNEQNVQNASIFSNRQVWQIAAAASSRAMDGWAFYSDLADGKIVAEDVTANGLMIEDQNDREKVAKIAEEFLKYFKRLFNQPDKDDAPTWAPEHLEYQFRCSAPEPDGSQAVLIAEEYYQGNLDWYAFDLHPDPEAYLEGSENQNVIKDELFTFLPAPVHFSGMPNLRWWEFEDHRTDFGDIDAHTTDIAKLLFAEFGLIFGNDWSIIPCVVPVGSLSEIKGLVITDTFGQRTLVRAAGRGKDDDWQRWTMFNLNTRGDTDKADNRLFLPPRVGKLLESLPIEKVSFSRDEMANMVWAVESIIPDEIGGGVNGFEAATDLQNYFKRIAPLETPAQSFSENDAFICYRIATTVPYNWIPFIPVHVPGSNRQIQLQRAAMPPITVGPETVYVEPHGAILQPHLGANTKYLVNEEEISRAGEMVTRTYQRTRWYDGQTYLWLGRRKRKERGKSSSGLKFDQIELKNKNESEGE